MSNKPDGTGTTNTTPGSCVDVPCKPNLTVVYRIHSSCGSIPFALEVNGKVPDDFKERALGVKCDGKSEIRRPAKPGDRLALYLNSDAHPDFRKQKVYAVTVGSNDVVVTIKEKSGKHADSDTPTLSETKSVKNAKGEERQTDFYSAPLTGDIWLKISHKYSTSEVDAILPTSIDKAISDAVKKFYDGSLSKTARTIAIALPAQGNTPVKQAQIFVGDGADKNPLENIQSFDLFKDGLPRVHPLGFLALIDAALDANVDKVTLSSTWRPILGSIAHRAGIGLDVNYLNKTHLNREELRGKGPHDGNVSEAEKEKFKEKEVAQKEAAEAKTELSKLETEHKNLLSLKKTNPNKADPIREKELEDAIPVARERVGTTNERARTSNAAWNEERDKNEPTKIKSYRASLGRCKHVRQIYDPWFIDDNSRDNTSAKPNEQHQPNEKLHATHLHITVDEPKLIKK